MKHRKRSGLPGGKPARGAGDPGWASLSLLALLLAAAAWAIPWLGRLGRGNQSVFRDFVTRSGDRLMDGGQELRFVGANVPGLILPYDFSLRIPERMVLPTAWEQEDGFKTLAQMNARVVRWWNLPIRAPDEKGPKGLATWHHVQGPGRFSEDAFRAVDQALAFANRYGVRVIFPLTAEAGDYLGGIGTYAAHRGKKRAEFYTDPQVREDFKATIRHVVGRRNRVTGRRYRDDRAILCWELGNELRAAPAEWTAEMAAYIKSLDPHHLVMDGRDDRVPAEPDPSTDVYTRHYYGGDWVANCRADREKTRGRRPLVIGEFGLTTDVPAVERFLAEVIANGTAGALIWSVATHHRDGGFCWHQIFTHPSLWSYHWPGFSSGAAQKEGEILAALRASAYRIQGVPAPPVPVPDPPVVFPVRDGTPLLSWRGSAGASSYDIERAAGRRGPWRRIAKEVSDADAAYRPLFSDISAKEGETWYYRVIAWSQSGPSRPSAAAGPVRVRRVCLADELRDLALAHAHSEGLSIANDRNALYAECLFRAKGAAGDWLVYRAPGELLSLDASVWFAGTPGEFTFLASADGAQYQVVPVQRQTRAYRGVGVALGRTCVRFTGKIPPGRGWLKLTWGAPAELDRVEVYHTGKGPWIR